MYELNTRDADKAVKDESDQEVLSQDCALVK